MDYRTLGRTGLRVGVLGFGCGNVGGLLVRGTPAEQERAVARAVDLGLNYFDTAPLYGDGQSETNLGRVQTAQVCFNLLNPSAAHALPRAFRRRISAGSSTMRPGVARA